MCGCALITVLVGAALGSPGISASEVTILYCRGVIHILQALRNSTLGITFDSLVCRIGIARLNGLKSRDDSVLNLVGCGIACQKTVNLLVEVVVFCVESLECLRTLLLPSEGISHSLLLGIEELAHLEIIKLCLTAKLE